MPPRDDNAAQAARVAAQLDVALGLLKELRAASQAGRDETSALKVRVGHLEDLARRLDKAVLAGDGASPSQTTRISLLQRDIDALPSKEDLLRFEASLKAAQADLKELKKFRRLIIGAALGGGSVGAGAVKLIALLSGG